MSSPDSSLRWVGGTPQRLVMTELQFLSKIEQTEAYRRDFFIWFNNQPDLVLESKQFPLSIDRHWRDYLLRYRPLPKK